MEQNVEMCSLYHSFLGEVGTGEIHAREKQRRSLRCCRKLEQMAFILDQSSMFPPSCFVRPDAPTSLPTSQDRLSLSPGTRIQSIKSISDARYVLGHSRGFSRPRSGGRCVSFTQPCVKFTQCSGPPRDPIARTQPGVWFRYTRDA